MKNLYDWVNIAVAKLDYNYIALFNSYHDDYFDTGCG